MSENRSFMDGIVYWFLIGLGVIILATLNIQRIQRQHRQGTEIATVRIAAKAGDTIYHVAEFLETGTDYTRFRTTDGKIIEIVKNEVTEK